MSRSALKHIAIHDGSHDYGYCWGFTIFRTVYTPDSNEAVTEALERLAVYAKYFVTKGAQLHPRVRRGEGQFNTRPNEELISRYYNELVQDEESLADASESEVGERFDAWITQHRRPVTARSTETNTRFLFCLMLDEESIDNILALPQDPYAPTNFRAHDEEEDECYVKVISNRMKTEEEYGGEGRYWLRVGIRDFLFLVCFFAAEDEPDVIIEELGWIDPEDGVQNLWGSGTKWQNEILRACGR
jgi:hypothetical protein